MAFSVVPSILHYVRVGVGQSLGEIAFALLGLDILDIELCDCGSRGTLIQVLLKFVQGAAVTLSLASDLSMEVSTIESDKLYRVRAYTSITSVLDVTGDS